MVMEKKHQPTRSFCNGVINFRKQIAYVNRKAVAGQASLKKRWRETDTAGSDVVQSGRPIFDDFFQHLWPYIRNNTANVVFQMVKRLWLIRIDQ
ncbi:hypothetical protein TNCV_3244221 [Trichonephila clavipes]|nr:hypothetical protein TNCV_3244221 [Trichonephila clavipes]